MSKEQSKETLKEFVEVIKKLSPKERQELKEILEGMMKDKKK